MLTKGGKQLSVLETRSGSTILSLDLQESGKSIAKYAPNISDFFNLGKDVLLHCGNALLCWNPDANSVFVSYKQILSGTKLQNTGPLFFMLNGKSLESFEKGTSLVHGLNQYSTKCDFYSITPDGSYLALVEENFYLKLFRTKDKMLIGQIRMAAKVTSLHVSKDGWFVILGTSDHRLFTYLIVDPKEEYKDLITTLPSRNVPEVED